MKKGYIAISIGKEPDGEDVVSVSDVYEEAWQAIDIMQDGLDSGKFTSGKVLELDIIPGEKEAGRIEKEKEREKEAEELASRNLKNLKRIKEMLESDYAGSGY